MTRTACACISLAFALLACGSPYLRSEPVSDRWIQVTHPTLPVTFEVPDNAERVVGASMGVRGLGLVRGPDGDPDMVDLYGLRFVSQALSRTYAVEIEIRRLTVRNPDVSAASIQQLARAIDHPDASVAFFTTVFLEPVQNDGVVFTRLGPEQISGLPAQRFLARIDDPNPLFRSSYDVTIVPRAPDEVWVIGARFDNQVTPKERQDIYPRIMRSVRFTDPPPVAN